MPKKYTFRADWDFMANKPSEVPVELSVIEHSEILARTQLSCIVGDQNQLQFYLYRTEQC